LYELDQNHQIPMLTSEQVLLWHHTFAATAAAQSHFPSNVGRLLGTITRTLTTDKGRPKLPKPFLGTYPMKPAQLRNISKHKATYEAKQEKDNANTIEARATAIREQWQQIINNGVQVHGWDIRHGSLLTSAVNDPHYVPVPALLKWAAKDDHQGQCKDLYHGLLSIPTDTRSILTSLAELSSPIGLYDIPLITPYPVLEEMEQITREKLPALQRYRLTIAVYANRLLPEVMMARDLHIIMSALDEFSYRLTQPLESCPVPQKPVFASAEYPKVVVEDTLDDDTEAEEKKEQDLTILGSTRDDGLTISAFTIPGLMKLLEHRGNDISNWKQPNNLQIDLMLHQKHAVCWMMQMESLGGFGINSILWEEREFWDGGKYYYSPALGQIRLAQPPTCKGGILADQMGLGKTMEVMGLILATLEILKSEQRAGMMYLQTTLIVVPPALVSQWISEIHKCCGDYLVVQYYDPKSQVFEDKSKARGTPDIVVTTYRSLESHAASKNLADKVWGRIVLDEMQEIRSSTSLIAKNCEKLISERRWMLSGTPFFEGIDDLRGELNFLSVVPFCAKLEDGFFDFAILDHWKQRSKYGRETLKIIGLLALRRSSSMTICETGAPLLGLQNLTIEFVPVTQRPSERALYCYLEHLVARELEMSEGHTSAALCLRLLREMSISPVLLNGGLGVSSQLQSLNGILIRENRRRLQSAGLEIAVDEDPKKILSRSDLVDDMFDANRGRTILSCWDAIRYLTQVQESVHTEADFVSEMTLGTGGGMARRNRATTSVDALIIDCKMKLAEANKKVSAARSKRARARWHLALELVTIGACPEYPKCIKRSVATLWKWRWLVEKRSHIDKHRSTSCFLRRGWRPSEKFATIDLYATNPGFAWAHARSVEINEIPNEVTFEEIKRSILEGISTEGKANIDGSVAIYAYKRKGSWNAVVQFEDLVHMNALVHKAAMKGGVTISHQQVIPSILEGQAESKAILDEIKAEHSVYPTITSRQKLKDIMKQHREAMLGLRIVSDSIHIDKFSFHVMLKQKSFRSAHPPSSTTLLDSSSATIDEANARLTQYVPVLKEEQDKLQKYQRGLKIPDHVKEMSAYETLVALAEKDYEHTWCPICMDQLGETKRNKAQAKLGMISLTHCGHIYCQMCLSEYMSTRQASHLQTQCPTCRKPLGIAREVTVVDPNLTGELENLDEKRIRAKRIIQAASKLLETSNGQLEAAMWEQLYLSIDLPVGVSRAGEPRLTAIPLEVLQHLRSATCMNTHNKPASTPLSGPLGFQNGLSSKIQALLSDLPKDERCVVFSSYATCINHLTFCLRNLDIPHQSLYKGQKVAAQEEALGDWKKSTTNADGSTFIPFPILVVQSGAAASGLTLTDACKIFLLEPFVRQEEEQQAFARCHRYGQTRPVHVKVYYTPVSVESRLLEWRKKALEGPSRSDSNVTTRFTSLDVVDNEEEDDECDYSRPEMVRDDEEFNQTLFLLGLMQSRRDKEAGD